MTLAGLVSGVTFWGMKLNARKTKTMRVSRSGTMHRMSPPLTIGGTVLKESEDLVILGVTFDSKLTFEKHLRLISRAASQRLGILRKSWLVFQDSSLLEIPVSSGMILLTPCSMVWDWRVSTAGGGCNALLSA